VPTEQTPALLLEKLLAEPAVRRLTMARNSARFQTPALCAALLESVRDAVFDRPEEALSRASLGVEISQSLADETPERADLRARAWGELANAKRVLCDFPGAREAFAFAWEELEQGTGEARLESLLSSHYACLLWATRDFPQCLRWAEHSIRLAQRDGDSELVGRQMVAKAVFEWGASRWTEAIETTRAALPLLDPARDARTFLVALTNLAVFLEGTGQIREALAQVERYRPLLSRETARRHHLNATWIEARLAKRLGHFQRAEQALREVLRGALEVKTPTHAAQARVELAILLQEQGRNDEVLELIQAAIEVYQAHGIEQDALAAFIVAQRAIEAKAVSTALLIELRDRLSKNGLGSLGPPLPSLTNPPG
jgi:tetratricopeptide (TPR) repeat protein